MTTLRDDIIRMAREAGFSVEQGFLLRVTGIDEDLERFAALVAAAERERIIAQNAPEIEKINAHIKALEDELAAIRARSNTAPPQRKPLTEEEIEEINRDLPLLHMQAAKGSVAFIFARAIERAHGIGDSNG